MIYVTLQQAKRLHELGFKEVCTRYYDQQGKRFFRVEELNRELRQKYLAVPDICQAEEWCYTNHGVLSTLSRLTFGGKPYLIVVAYRSIRMIPIIAGRKFISYHAAKLAALNKTLTIIQQTQKSLSK